MTVAVSFDRKAVEIVWNTDIVIGDTVTIRCENPVDPDPPTGHHGDGDVSIRTSVKNDGRGVITFPAKYHGFCLVTVIGSSSGEDQGWIDVGGHGDIES